MVESSSRIADASESQTDRKPIRYSPWCRLRGRVIALRVVEFPERLFLENRALQTRYLPLPPTHVQAARGLHRC
jgi:hypothetical protein